MTTFANTKEYNQAHPERAFPSRDVYLSQTAVLGDVDGDNGEEVTIDFLPGGADGDPEQRGNLVARASNETGSVALLASDITRQEVIRRLIGGPRACGTLQRVRLSLK